MEPVSARHRFWLDSRAGKLGQPSGIRAADLADIFYELYSNDLPAPDYNILDDKILQHRWNWNSPFPGAASLRMAFIESFTREFFVFMQKTVHALDLMEDIRGFHHPIHWPVVLPHPDLWGTSLQHAWCPRPGTPNPPVCRNAILDHHVPLQSYHEIEFLCEKLTSQAIRDKKAQPFPLARLNRVLELGFAKTMDLLRSQGCGKKPPSSHAAPRHRHMTVNSLGRWVDPSPSTGEHINLD
jgi:hypothetical protein